MHTVALLWILPPPPYSQIPVTASTYLKPSSGALAYLTRARTFCSALDSSPTLFTNPSDYKHLLEAK